MGKKRKSDMRIERPVSAGGVVYRKGPGGIEILLCGHIDPQMWVLPKGTPEPGESLEETAVREVIEETGLEVVIETRIASIQYWFVWEGVKNFKTVHFYLMSPVGGSTDRHDPEFDMVQWFPAEEARAALTHDNEVKIFHKALSIIAQIETAGAQRC